MIGPYAYTPYIWPMLTLAALLSVLGISAWRLRHTPAGTPFVCGSLLWAVWTFGAAMELAAVEPGTKLLWFGLQSAMKIPVTTCQVAFVLILTGQGRWLTRKTVWLMAFACVLNIVAIATNPVHGLFWTDISFAEDVRTTSGPLLWASIGYGFFGLFAVSAIALIGLFIRSPRHRLFVCLMLGAGLVTRAAATLDALSLNPAAPLDLTLLASIFPAVVYYLALFRFRVLGVVPLGREQAIERMDSGVLIVDAAGYLVDINDAARQLLGLPPDGVIFDEAARALAAYPDVGALLHKDSAATAELGLEGEGGSKYVQVNVSPLVDANGIGLGRLMLLQDVTEQALARQFRAQQQRTLAVMEERERLAREMHDGLAQALAAAYLQATTAKWLLARGEPVQANVCLDHLAEAVLEAEADVREYLLGVQAVGSTEGAFFPALREYLERFTERYGLTVELRVSPQVEGGRLEQDVASQLLRIIQEALSNVRKHAHARCAQVRFSLDGEEVRVAVVDDGCGFDAAEGTMEGDGFGLRSMRQRAEAVGGTLDVVSSPGGGTQVVARVPLQV